MQYVLYTTWGQNTGSLDFTGFPLFLASNLGVWGTGRRMSGFLLTYLMYAIINDTMGVYAGFSITVYDVQGFQIGTATDEIMREIRTRNREEQVKVREDWAFKYLDGRFRLWKGY